MKAGAQPGVETEDVVGDVVLGPHQVPVLAVEGVPELGHGHRQIVLLTVAQQDVLQRTASSLNWHHVTIGSIVCEASCLPASQTNTENPL